ncbi:MED14-domain-containing protein [Glonium stellatum]|uniref:Mediator of RNA polymerase II transcription subunit 14 n=1 Tax=Glonium stellatum TaxID=574774 RepID=A0A8E2EPQ8_9PEZI|nr:MED14-domain-containing protein [Glonium stellatum]
MVNGDRAIPQLDGPAEVNSAVTVNGKHLYTAGQADIPPSLLELPPEIRHITETYQPFSKLLTRVAQECFNSLSDLLTRMAEMPVSHQPGGLMTNGVNNHAMTNGAGNTSTNNVHKKIMMMRFADDQRTRFIKLLVLSQWGRQAEEVGKLIDVVAWTREQEECYDHAAYWLGDLKLQMAGAKISNPDIKTALEVLSTGKAPWMPDLRYIPPEPLSPQKTLRLLRNINTLLSIRLNLHEELPRHLKNWSVASGRATFVIPSEFELDVSASSEDTSTPWYFIDIRLLFSPAPEIPDSQFRGMIEWQANHSLATSGLSGCFDLIHNFVLTHKIAVLKAQAFELSAANWAGSIRVEPVRRSLVVQYWTDMSGGKSWIEIGIASGKPKNGKVSWRGPGISHLAVRWFRQGVEVKDSTLTFDWGVLSMEKMLRKVIALHISHILETLRDRLITSVQANPNLSARATISDSEPSDCMLEAALGNSMNKITVLIHPVTGRFTFRPCTAISAHVEYELNYAKEPITNPSSRISSLLCSTLQNSIERQAQQLGWTKLSNLNLKNDAIKAAFKQEVIRHTFFRGQGWTSNWALAAVINLTGESWWIVELEDEITGGSIMTAEQIRINLELQRREPVSRIVLSRIERIAVAKISFSATIRVLRARNIPFSIRMQPLPSSTSAANPQASLQIPMLFIKTPALLALDGMRQNKWAQEGLRLVHHGFDASKGQVRHVVLGTMVKDMTTSLSKLLTTSNDVDVAFRDKGGFSILLRTPFGASFVDHLIERLRDIEQLRNFVTILHKRKLVCETVSLAKVVFRYSATLTATVLFNPGAPIRLQLAPENPHQRIRTLLSALINDKQINSAAAGLGLDNFTRCLISTLPLLRCFDAMEAANPGLIANPAIHPHDVYYYRITYSNPLCSFDIRLRVQHDTLKWHIDDNNNKLPDSRPAPERPKTIVRPEPLAKALKVLYKEQGNDWVGVRTGIVAGLEGVEEAVKRLDEVVRGFAVETPAPAPAKPSTKEPEVTVKPEIKTRASERDVITID